MDNFLKIYMPLFLLAFIVSVFVVPSVRVYRQTGINPFRFATKHNEAHDYIGGTMKVFILLLLIAVLIFSFSNTAYEYLAPIEYLEQDNFKIAGLIIGHLSWIGIMVAQQQMKQSWRIGIDYEHKTDLISSGLFAKSRNPIFLFLLFSLTGLFMVLPNAITLAVFFAAYIVLQITMRLEEDFLLKQHGEQYLKYKNKVARLI